MSYSLDDVLPPRKAQHIDASSVTWMIVGHSLWIASIMWLCLLGAGVGWLVVAVPHLAALAFVTVAWRRRASSVAAARAVGWVSTPVFGASLALLVTSIPDGARLLNEPSNQFALNSTQAIGLAILVLDVLLSVPTIGAFVASVIHARGFRDG